MTKARKWRPALWMVLGGALLATLALSFAGLIALRYLGPNLGFRNAAAVLGALILCATLGLGLILVRLLLRPVNALSGQAHMLRSNPQHMRLPTLQHFGTRELCDLAHSITAMAQSLQDREVQIRSFTDHVTHALKTPVTAIRAAAELLADGDLCAVDRDLVTQILGANAQMQTQLEALRRVTAARQPGHYGETRLEALLPRMMADHPTLRLRATGASALPLAASGLQIVLTHLLDNAAQHGATEVTLHADQSLGHPTLTVSDNGLGISPGNRTQVFTPFFTTRPDQGGTGMGLTIVANLMQAHGGRVTLVASDTGACFILSFAEPD